MQTYITLFGSVGDALNFGTNPDADTRIDTFSPEWILFFRQCRPKKKKFSYVFLLIFYFLKVHLHHFSKSTRSHKTVGINFFLQFCLKIEGSISLTNVSCRPKNIWILRIRIRNTVIWLVSQYSQLRLYRTSGNKKSSVGDP